LSNIEIYRLVAEAYASYYLGSDYIKDVATRYLNIFGKWRWMGPQVPNYVKTVMGGAYEMLMSQGITRSVISEDLKDLRRRADKAGTFNYLITKTPPNQEINLIIKDRKKKKQGRKKSQQEKEVNVLVG